MNNLIKFVLLLCLVSPAHAQKIYQLPQQATLNYNSLFLTTVDDVGGGSRHTSYGQLSNQLASAILGYTSDPNKSSNGPIAGTINQNRMRVPPRVWGTWNDYPIPITTGWGNSTNVNEVYIKTLCDWWSTNGMRDAGWKYIILEENWQTGLDANGYFIVNTAAYKFPSGLTNLMAYIKSKGFIPGIYTSVNPNSGGNTCENFASTCYTNLDKHFQQFANWGVEMVFVDSCNGYYDPWTDVPGQVVNGTDARYMQRINLINAAINKSGKSMAWLNTTPTFLQRGYSSPYSYSQQNITFTSPDGGDRWDFVPTTDLDQILLRTYTNSLNAWYDTTMPGHYWYQGQINNSSSQLYTVNQYNTVMCLQSMTCGAIFIDSQLRHIISGASGAITNTYPYLGPWANPPSTWYDSYTAIKTNLEVAAIHQDLAVVPAKQIYSNSQAYAWWRPLGRKELPAEHALLLVNTASTPQAITIPFNLFAPTNSYFSFRDVVALTNFPAPLTNSLTVTIQPTNCMMLRLSPPVFAQAVANTIVTNQESVIGWQSIAATGTGLTKFSMATYQDNGGGTGPFYASEGWVQSAGNASGGIRTVIPVPYWATNMQTVFALYASNVVAITNEFTLDVYFPTGRAQCSPANLATMSNNITMTSGTGYVWVTNNCSWPATNTPKVMNIIFDPTSNAGPRNVIGPVKVNFTGTVQTPW